MKTHITREQFDELSRRHQISWSLYAPPPAFYPPGYFDLPDIGCMIEYLDDHGLYRDPETGMTHADSIPADQLCDWLWSRTAAHLAYGDDPTPLPDYAHVGVR